MSAGSQPVHARERRYQHSDGGYHVILPGNLEWGASIPNSPGRTVMVTNAHGIVCWDMKERGSDGCSGLGVSCTPALRRVPCR
jgi:hypothetical protein